jgi:hypothetical protein
MMYQSDEFIQEGFPNEIKPVTPPSKARDIQRTPEEGAEISPTSVTDSPRDNDRLRMLINANTASPERSEQSTKSTFVDRLKGAKAYVPSVVQPCMAPPQPQQPPDGMVVYNDGDYEGGQIQNYWMDKFELAAS